MNARRFSGLVTVAAMAFMVLAGAGGAGTASADTTTLCQHGSPTQPPCQAGFIIYTGKIETSVAKATLTTSLGTISCASSSFKGEVLKGEGEPAAIGEVSGFSFEECKTAEGVKCTLSPKNLPYEASIVGMSNKGSMTVSDSTGVGSKVECGFSIDCELLAKSTELSFAGGEPAVITASEVKFEAVGLMCPKTATWTATYKLAKPSFLSIA